MDSQRSLLILCQCEISIFLNIEDVLDFKVLSPVEKFLANGISKGMEWYYRGSINYTVYSALIEFVKGFVNIPNLFSFRKVSNQWC